MQVSLFDAPARLPTPPIQQSGFPKRGQITRERAEACRHLARIVMGGLPSTLLRDNYLREAEEIEAQLAGGSIPTPIDAADPFELGPAPQQVEHSVATPAKVTRLTVQDVKPKQRLRFIEDDAYPHLGFERHTAKAGDVVVVESVGALGVLVKRSPSPHESHLFWASLSKLEVVD